MGTIIYDARRIKAYEGMQELGKISGKSQTYIDELWKNIVTNGDLMKEYIYYLEHHTFLDELHVEGYGLTDIYMWLIHRYNIMQDYGKNGEDCNKEAVVLDAFCYMIKLREDPLKYVKLLENGFGQGMDQI